MKRRHSGAENLSILRNRSGNRPELRSFRQRAHAELDRLVNDLLNEGATVRGIAVVVAFSNKSGICSRSKETYESNYEMLVALDCATTKFRLDAFGVEGGKP